MDSSNSNSETQEKTILSSSVLLVISRAGSQLSNLVLLLTAARILTPAEFGAFSLVSVTILILVQVADSGWYEYACKTPKSEPFPPELFWNANFSGIALSTVGALMSGLLWLITKSNVYSFLMLVMSVLPFLQTHVTLQNGVHTQRGDIIKLPLSLIPGEICGLTLGILALLNGFHVFSLAIHKIVSVSITLLILGLWGGWIARFQYEIHRALEIIRFCWQLLLTRITSFFQGFGSEYLIGALLGLTDVGIFRAAQRLSGAVAEIISEPARFMAWAILPTAWGKEKQASSAFPIAVAELVSAVLLFAIPTCVGLAILSESIVELLLGPGWGPTAQVLVYLCFARIASVITPLPGVVLPLDQAESKMPRLMLILTFISLGCLAAIGWKGVVWAAISQVIASIIMTPVVFLALRKHGGIEMRSLLVDVAKISIAAAGLAAGILLSWPVLSDQQFPILIEMGILVIGGALLYGAFILILKPRSARLLLSSLR